MSLIVDNHGPLIVATNFWELDLAKAGKVFVSVNAGAIRLLLPQQHRPAIEEMRAAKYIILSRGPWKDVAAEIGADDAVELLFEDNSDDPYSLHLTKESFDSLPGEPEPERQWVLSVWDQKKGKPHKALERACHWRRVPMIPWLKRWGES